MRLAAVVTGIGLGLFAVAVLRFATFGATLQEGPMVGAMFNVAHVNGLVIGLAILSHLPAAWPKLA